MLEQSRVLAVEYETTQDWSLLENASPPTVANIATEAAGELEAETFTLEMTYDALNRVVTQTTPDNSVTTSTYNEAGLLESVAANVRGAGSTTAFVDNFVGMS